MNDLDKQKAERARREANRYELVLFLQFAGSGCIVIVFVALLAWLLGWF